MGKGWLVVLSLSIVLLCGCVSSTDANRVGDDFNREEAAKTRMSLGLTYLKNNNYTQAKKNLDKALEFYPHSGDVHYALAYYYQLVGDNERAESAYKTAISLSPNSGDIMNSYGAFQCQNGRYAEAKRYFLKAIDSKHYANAAETYENLALCAQSQGNLDDAIAYLEDAVKHQPGRPKSLLLLSELYVAERQWDNAKRTLSTYQRVASTTPNVLWMSYEVAKSQGDESKALAYGNRLLEQFPQSALAERVQQQINTSKPQIMRSLKANPSEGSPPAEESSANEKSTSKNSEVSKETPQFHIVKQGENLYRISLMHNIKVATLQTWNNLEDPGAIFAGMKLWLVPTQLQEK